MTDKSARASAPLRTPLSCTIITKNEGDRLERCIRAVADLADEIVLVDCGSSDDTAAVAERLGARVVFNAWTGYGPQKRFAEDAASHNWIFNLDADEVVTPALAREIRALMNHTPPLSAYRVHIRNVYPGWTHPNLLAETNHYVRLYDKRVVRFRDSPVHDTVETGSRPVGRLKGPVWHFSGRSFEHIERKYDDYTSLQAKTLRKPVWWLRLRLVFEYPSVFVRYYVLRGHFTGGRDGFTSSRIAARARVNRLRKMLEAQTGAGAQRSRR